MQNSYEWEQYWAYWHSVVQEFYLVTSKTYSNTKVSSAVKTSSTVLSHDNWQHRQVSKNRPRVLKIGQDEIYNKKPCAQTDSTFSDSAIIYQPDSSQYICFLALFE